MFKPTSESPETASADLSEEDRYRLLAPERRRLALDVLARRDSPVGVEDLAATVAARERDTDDPDAATVDRVAIALYHCHLPKLADLGVVEFDPAEKCVDPAPINGDCLEAAWRAP